MTSFFGRVLRLEGYQGWPVHEPLRVRLAEARHAAALAQSLTGLDGLDIHCEAGNCVSVDGVHGDRAVVAVLDAIRAALAGEPSASAHVLLDGREYHMQGE